jgi:hypothetical protein
MADVDTLKADIIAWMLDRIEITPNLDNFIRLAEADFQREIRVRMMEKATDITQETDGSYTLPTDFLEWRQAHIGTGLPLKLVGEDYFTNLESLSLTGAAKFMILRASKILLIPEPASLSLTLGYYAKIPSIFDGSNWLYTNHPGVYLFKSCMYAADYLGDDGQKQRFAERASGEIDKIMAADDRNRWSKTTSLYQGSRGPRP